MLRTVLPSQTSTCPELAASSDPQASWASSLSSPGRGEKLQCWQAAGLRLDQGLVLCRRTLPVWVGRCGGVSLADTSMCRSWAEQAGRACMVPSALVPARLGSAPSECSSRACCSISAHTPEPGQLSRPGASLGCAQPSSQLQRPGVPLGIGISLPCMRMGKWGWWDGG